MVWTVFLLIALTSARMSLSFAERRADMPRPRLKATGETLEVVIIAVCAVFLVVRPFLIQPYYIPSGSMFPTLRVDDRILVNKLAYRFSDPKRGDVVVFHAPQKAAMDMNDLEGKDFVKRVIAVPGDVVSVHDGVTFVNGAAQKEPYTQEAPDYDFAPFTIPEGKLFVMGDNRNHSNDSHRWGTLDRDLLIGRATCVFWPPSRAGGIR